MVHGNFPGRLKLTEGRVTPWYWEQDVRLPDISNNAGSCQDLFLFFPFFLFFFGHTTPFTPKSGLSCSTRVEEPTLLCNQIGH
jgi:hypothetical protein